MTENFYINDLDNGKVSVSLEKGGAYLDESGLVRINGGEENGGFDLVSKDNAVYYEIGMNDAKSYYEVGRVTFLVYEEFEYVDKSDLDSKPKYYSFKDFIVDDKGLDYNFTPHNTSMVIKNGAIVKMSKVYMP